MKRMLLIGVALALLVGAGPAAAQTPPTAGPLDSVRFDYRDADLSTYQVIRFELCVDGQASGCVQSDPAAARFTPSTDQGGAPAAGESAYKIQIPALTAGNHSLIIRACNASVCTDSTPLPFTFAIVPPAATVRGFVSGDEETR